MCVCTYIYIYIHVYIPSHIYDAGLPHPPLPPYPMVSPLACQWVVVLFGLVAFPVWSCLASSPPFLWSGACGLFRWPSPACGGAVCST